MLGPMNEMFCPGVYVWVNKAINLREAPMGLLYYWGRTNPAVNGGLQKEKRYRAMQRLLYRFGGDADSRSTQGRKLAILSSQCTIIGLIHEANRR